MSNTGYARVSASDQDPAAQIAALQAAGCDPIYIERASGTTMDRTQWAECNRSLGRGDTLVVVRIDRLGRSLVDLVDTLDNLHARGIQFRSLEERIDTSTALGRMFYQLAGAVAGYERIGRPPALTPEQRTIARQLRTQGKSVAVIARILGVSPSTIRRATTRR